MRRRITAVLLALSLLCGAVSFAAAETPPVLCEEAAERIRKAETVSWAGGKYVLADGELICTEDSRVVLSGAETIRPWGDGILATVPDEGAFTVGPEGRAELMSLCGEISFDSAYFRTENGVAMLLDTEQNRGLFIQSLKYGTVFRADPGDGWYADEYAAFRNDETGDAYIIVLYINWKDSAQQDKTMLYRENGDLLWERPLHPVRNAYWRYGTNGLLAGYSGGRSVLVDIYTGETKVTLEPKWEWRPYDAQYEIFEDNTAVAECGSLEEGSAVVSLDGEILMRAPFIFDRGAYTSGYTLSTEDGSIYSWSAEGNRIRQVFYDPESWESREEDIDPEDLPEPCISTLFCWIRTG